MSADLLWPVEVVSVGGDGMTAAERRALAVDDDLVESREMSSLPWQPAWSWYPLGLPHWGIAKAGEVPRVWFAGRPQGQERMVLQETVLAVGRRREALSPLTRANLDTLSAHVTLAVLTTPDCPRCAQAVRWAHAMALYQPKIVSVAIMLDACWELTKSLKVASVPVIFIGCHRIDGIVDEWTLGQRVSAVGHQAAPLGETLEVTDHQREE